MAMAMALGSADPLPASHAHKFAAILVVPNVLGNVFPEPVTLLNLIGTKLVFNCCLRYALSFEAFSNLWGHKPTLTHKIILK